MEFISDYFYIIILIVGAIAQWLKSRSESAEKTTYDHDEPGYHPEALEDLESEAERRNARPAVPPPLPPAGGALPGVGRSPVPNLQRKMPPPPLPAAAAIDTSDELARQRELMEKAREFKRQKRARTAKEPREPDTKPAVLTAAAGSLKARLHNRRELRSAFVLKEVLDKPIGLR